MSDIIERLTELSDLMMDGRPYNDSDFTNIDEAIVEIERLRKERDEFENNAIGESTAREMALNVMYNDAMTVIEQLRKERDEARREICQFRSTSYPHDMKEVYEIADSREWDCYKENTNG